MSSTSGWRVGDQVSVCPNGKESDRVVGTVISIDEPGRSRGVRVHFGQLVRGVDNCYATHDELTLVRRGELRPVVGPDEPPSHSAAHSGQPPTTADGGIGPLVAPHDRPGAHRDFGAT